MTEEVKIGGVSLNFKHYSGVDLYSDGSIENDLLEIVKKYKRGLPEGDRGEEQLAYTVSSV